MKIEHLINVIIKRKLQYWNTQVAFNCETIHFFFVQVRSRALRTINYSLSIPNRTTPFPLKDLVELLAFESEQEAVEHCTFYALDADEQFVNLSKATFIEPEDKLAPKIATKLIESKRKISIGEVSTFTRDIDLLFVFFA